MLRNALVHWIMFQRASPPWSHRKEGFRVVFPTCINLFFPKHYRIEAMGIEAMVLRLPAVSHRAFQLRFDRISASSKVIIVRSTLGTRMPARFAWILLRLEFLLPCRMYFCVVWYNKNLRGGIDTSKKYIHSSIVLWARDQGQPQIR